MDQLKPDALVAPDYAGTSPPARAGYPLVSVPAGFRTNGLPANLMFFGRAFSEPTLIRLAYAFEQHVKARRPPASVPTSFPG
jgi:amidase